MAGITQSERHVSISTPLGGDKLVFWRMSAREGLSQLFNYELDLLSADGNIDYESLLAKTATVTLKKDENSERYFHGYITDFAYLGTSYDIQLASTGEFNQYHVYRATLKPWLWFLSRTADCRIFQNKKVPDIIKEVFRDNGFSDIQDSLSNKGKFLEREYCVQYRETDLEFVSRLMEQEGIYYYFKHDDNKHTLVLANSIDAHKSAGDIMFFPPDEHERRIEQHIDSWHVDSKVRSGQYAVTEYNFVKPKDNLEARSVNPSKHPLANTEIFDYPGEYKDKDTSVSIGEEFAKIRLEEERSSYEVVTGRGNSRLISVGSLFNLTDFPRDDQNREYLITTVDYEIYSDDYTSTSGREEDAGKLHPYLCKFTAMQRAKPYRPPRATPKPVVRGPQTAVVVGPKGEEIHTDEHGRVRVQFHWDRYGKNDENSSCWIRVGQPWAGKQWGGVFLPRIGHEVIVDFLEGDPDRPIITGSVYNGDNKPPYKLPTNKTQSGFKSRSTLDGTDATFNELRFEDKKGEEEVYFHAEKDFNRVVENNDTLKVGFDDKDDGDQTIEIFNNRTLKVGDPTAPDGSQTTEIHKDRTNTLNTGNDTIQVKMGDRTVNVDLGKIFEEAMQSIELKVGASSIKLEPAKITIKSPQIAIQADATLDAKSPMTTINGDATLTLKGGMIMIN
jgi:type VI secretion system secreted protein VgrG